MFAPIYLTFIKMNSLSHEHSSWTKSPLLHFTQIFKSAMVISLTELSSNLTSRTVKNVLEDKDAGTELVFGENNRKLSLLTLLLHLHITEWHSDSKSYSGGTAMVEESPFLRLFDGN